jgi:hypothetical protein
MFVLAAPSMPCYHYLINGSPYTYLFSLQTYANIEAMNKRDRP